MVEPDGLLRRDRLLEAVDPDAVLVALRSGRLRRVQRAVYVPRRIVPSSLSMARAAIISSGVPDAVASHDTAARVHGLMVADGRSAQHVTVPRSGRRIQRRDLRFHSRGLAVGDVVRMTGGAGAVPVTSVPRTLADVAADRDRLWAVWAIDDALRRRITTRGHISQVLAGWRGGSSCAVATTVLSLADGVAESVLETAGRLTLHDHGVPLPVPQYLLRDTSGAVVARLDGAYLRQRIAIEWDGRDVHDRVDAVFADRLRQNHLPELGWTILRFTWFDVTRDPAGVADRVRRSLGIRAA